MLRHHTSLSEPPHDDAEEHRRIQDRFSPLIAADHDRVRIQNPLTGKYDDTAPFDRVPVDAIPAVHLARRRLFKTFAADLDAHGDGDEAAALAARDAETCWERMTDAGIRPVTAESGPSRGRWVEATFPEGLPAALAREAVLRLAISCASLDKGPMLNPRTGCIRPIGARHRHGGWSRLIEALHDEDEAAERLARGNSVETFQQFVDSLDSLPPLPPLSSLPRIGGRETPPPHLSTVSPWVKGVLTTEILDIVERGRKEVGDGTRSAKIDRVAYLARRAGWGVQAAFELARGSPHMRGRFEEEAAGGRDGDWLYWLRSWDRPRSGRLVVVPPELAGAVARTRALTRGLFGPGDRERRNLAVHMGFLDQVLAEGTPRFRWSEWEIGGRAHISDGSAYAACEANIGRGLLIAVERGTFSPVQGTLWEVPLIGDAEGGPPPHTSGAIRLVASDNGTHSAVDSGTDTDLVLSQPAGAENNGAAGSSPFLIPSQRAGGQRGRGAESARDQENVEGNAAGIRDEEEGEARLLPREHPSFGHGRLGDPAWRAHAHLLVEGPSGRAEVARALGLCPSRASEVLAALGEWGLAKQVAGRTWEAVEVGVEHLDRIFPELEARRRARRRPRKRHRVRWPRGSGGMRAPGKPPEAAVESGSTTRPMVVGVDTVVSASGDSYDRLVAGYPPRAQVFGSARGSEAVDAPP